MRASGLCASVRDARRIPSGVAEITGVLLQRAAPQLARRRRARELGWSPRTLAWATARARGMTPKQIIDERLVLEARRLLAHSARPVHRVGAALGFEDASNFTAWFRQRAGALPSRFRADQRRVQGQDGLCGE